jgi:PKD domain-containing protein
MSVKKSLMLWAATLVLAIPLVLAGSALATGIDGGYVGTDACLACHNGASASNKTSFKKAGHPYKLRTTKGLTPVASGGDNVTTITDPLSALQLNNTPLCTDINALTLGDGCKDWPNAGDNPTSYFVANPGTGKLDWSGVQYVVGGFHAKFRWALKDTHNLCSGPTATPADCKTGYIVTGTTQYNMEAALPGNMLSDWSGYNSNTDKGYDCAICHNTNGIAKNNSWNDSGSSTFGNRSQPWTDMGWGSLLTVGTNTLTNAGGFKTEWTFDGVQCEACHGKGSDGTSSGHADGTGSQNVLAIVSSEAAALNTTSIPAASGSYTTALSGKIEICAMCHIRGSNTSGGKEWGAASLNRTLRNGAEMQAGNGTETAENRAFIKHHEQYNEMVGLSTSLTDTNPANGDGVHRQLNCTSCHNPHQRASQVIPAIASAMGITDNNLTAQQRGAIVSCESCHGAKPTKFTMAGVTCVDCHMGEAVRSAPAAGLMGTWGKKADVKSHIFKIDVNATDIVRSKNTVTDGAGVLIPVATAKNALTVDYACGKCHDSSLAAAQGTQGLGAGVTTALSRAHAQFAATKMHVMVTSSGSYSMDTLNHMKGLSTTPNTCSACHVGASYTDPVDVATTCGMCHGASGPGPNKSLAVLTEIARTMHNFSAATNAAPVVGSASLVTGPTATIAAANAYSVSFNDTSSDADGNNTVTVTVNWGDGTVETAAAGSTFAHTYTRGKTYTIYHSVSDGSKSANEKITATVPLKYSITCTVTSGAGTYLSLKKNGHTVKAAKTTGGSYTFTNVVPNDYTIKAYKRGVTFTTNADVVSVTNADVTKTIQ